jgi:hypothetical protein
MERTPHEREAPVELAPAEFRRLGHALVDDIAGFLESLPARPVTRDATPEEIRALLPQGGPRRPARRPTACWRRAHGCCSTTRS